LTEGGSLLLDDISELDLLQQRWVLRASQGHILRIGSSVVRKVGVRLLLGTGTDVVELVQAARFREDLFEALQSTIIRLPTSSVDSR
jgi:DNA-binding NtrC family response regulator